MRLRLLGCLRAVCAIVTLLPPLAALAETVTLPNGYSLGPLAELRDEIAFPELSPEQKQTLASQARLIIEQLYVNRYYKEAYYGQSVAIGDQMANIEVNAAELPTEILEFEIADVWNSQRDGHLKFFFPKPYACYASMMPFSLVEVFAPDAEHAVVVKSLRSFAGSLEGVPRVGDELVSYAGMPVQQAIEEQIAMYGGANNSGGYAQALYTLTVRDHRFHRVPDEDSVTMTFQTPSGSQYTVNLPWTTERDDKCVAPPGGVSSSLRDASGLDPSVPDLSLRMDMQAEDSLNEYQLLCANLESTYGIEENPKGLVLNPTDVQGIAWARYENRFGTFGYLKLGTFMNSKSQADQAFKLIRDLLTVELRNTRGLILDLRGNPGGMITLADRLPELFAARDVPVQGARLINTDLNAFVLNNSPLGTGPNAQWSALINEVAGTDARYTRTATFTTKADANEVGQAYFGPVAVLTNALTFSAAEHFAALMQDERLGTIWGEDLKTGGSGANVMEHATFVRNVGDPFTELPAGQAMRVAWRQFLRTGRNAGMVLEDQAVTADRRVRLTLEEILTGTPIQLDRITADLAFLSNGGVPSAYFEFGRQTETSIDDMELNLTVEHTDEVQVRIGGALVSRMNVGAGPAKVVRIALPTAGVRIGDILNIELGGLKYGNQVWRLKKQLTVLGHMLDVPAGGLAFEFGTATTTDPFVVLDTEPPARSRQENGWRLRNGSLGIGDGIQYEPNVNSDLSLMLDLSDRTSATLEVTADVQIEMKYDYVDVYVTFGDENLLLKRWTGRLPTATYTYNLSAAAGDRNVGLHFLFYSDGYRTDRGVEITRLRLW